MMNQLFTAAAEAAEEAILKFIVTGGDIQWEKQAGLSNKSIY